MQNTIINKDADFVFLEKQLNKSNFDYDQICKTNEGLIHENKQMMEEIGSLKKILKKIDEWKNNLFNYILKQDYPEKDILKGMLIDFPTYSEIKENYESLKNFNYRHNQNSNIYNRGGDYLLSSFNSYSKNFDYDKNSFNVNNEKEKFNSNYIPQEDSLKIKIRTVDDYSEKPNFPSRNFDEMQFYSEENINNNKRANNYDNLTNDEKRTFYENENTKKYNLFNYFICIFSIYLISNNLNLVLLDSLKKFQMIKTRIKKKK